MRSLLTLSFIMLLLFLSCDKRQTKNEALQQAIASFNLKNPAVERIGPEMEVDIVTDTIIFDTFKIRIKNFTSSEEENFISEAADLPSNKKKYSPIFAAEICVSKASKDIFNMYLSAKEFKMVAPPDPFWDNATLQHAWVNQELSNTNSVTLDISFINLQNHNYKLYRMAIDADGHHSVTMIEQNI